MKVNFPKTPKTVEIKNIPTGSTFIAQRTGIKEKGLYMRTDINSGIVRLTNPRYLNDVIAVNLSSGQLRRFDPTELVEPIVAEVTCN
jgi:hypothetical protein